MPPTTPASAAAHRPPAPRAGRPEAQLYVISTHKVRERGGEPPHSWVPYGMQHAWRPGARRTLCGEWTTGWTVFWERRFSAGPAAACPACVEASLPAASRRRLDPVHGVPA